MDNVSNHNMALTLLRQENENLEKALKVLQLDDSERKERIHQLSMENDALKSELKKERETNELLKKYMKRQDRFIAYLRENRNSFHDETGHKATGNNKKHTLLCRKRSNSLPK